MERLKKKKKGVSMSDAGGPVSINLPKHVIERITNYFSAPEIGIERYSKTWSSASQFPFLWLKLDFRGDTVSTDMICRILQNSPLLTSLTLINIPDVVCVLRQMCRCCQRLKHLTIRFCHTGKDTWDQVSVPESTIRNIISSCPKLTYLDLKGTPFFGKLFYKELVHLSNLRTLRIGYNSLLRPRDLLTIASACRGRLTYFSFVHSFNGPPPPVRLYGSEPPKRMQKSGGNRYRILRDYKLQGEERASQPLTGRECSFLLDMLGPNLIILELEVNAVDGMVFTVLTARCPNLRCLRLYNAINLPGEVIARIPTEMRQLSHLSLKKAYLASDEDLLQLVRWRSDEDAFKSVSEQESTSDITSTGSGIEDTKIENEMERWWEGAFSTEDEFSEISSKGRSEPEELSEQKDSLLSLELTMCPSVSDNVLQTLVDNPVTDSLQCLGLRGCQRVTDYGLDLLKSCSSLKHLDVSYVNAMKGPSKEWIASIPKHLPFLKTLVVGFIKEDSERKAALTELIKTMPTLSIKKSISMYSTKGKSLS